MPWAIGGLFVAPMVLNPFVAVVPARRATRKAGPLRMLPVELTLLNDLPVFTEGETRARVWFGDLGQGDPGFLVSFLDDNAFGREADKSFWTRGDSRADLVFKADQPDPQGRLHGRGRPGAGRRDDHARRSKRYDVHLDAGADAADHGMRCRRGCSTRRKCRACASGTRRSRRSGGFTPIFYDANANDARYLGARVKPMLEARRERRLEVRDRGRHLEPADGRGGPHGHRARADARAARRRARRRTSSSRRRTGFGRQASAYLATWLTDVTSSEGRPIDQVISLRYPSYAVRHPHHVCWLNHTMREYYDLWPTRSARR